MDEFFQFISKSERVRVRLIREARAIYDSIFPPADPAGEQQGRVAPATHGVSVANGQCSEGPFS
jgi:hypothetical protein